MSRGSEGTMSTVSSSSNSSGFPPDHDMDSPDGRNMIKRNSDLDSPVYALADLSLSKCKKYAKFNIDLQLYTFYPCFFMCRT